MATRLSAPTTVVWVIALLVGGVGILNHLGVLHLRIGVEDFWLVGGSLILLLAANLFRGL
jgi:hypothetical protein